MFNAFATFVAFLFVSIITSNFDIDCVLFFLFGVVF